TFELGVAILFPYTTLFRSEEGGAWGMALLAAYHVKSHRQTLEDFLLKDVFKEVEEKVLAPTKEGVIIFNDYVEKYHSVLQLEKLDRKSTRLNSSHVSISYA